MFHNWHCYNCSENIIDIIQYHITSHKIGRCCSRVIQPQPKLCSKIDVIAGYIGYHVHGAYILKKPANHINLHRNLSLLKMNMCNSPQSLAFPEERIPLAPLVPEFPLFPTLPTFRASASTSHVPRKLPASSRASSRFQASSSSKRCC